MREADLTDLKELPERSEVIKRYLEFALQNPELVYSQELFTYAMTGSYSPVFDSLDESEEELHKEIVKLVRESQSDFDLVATGQSGDRIDLGVMPNHSELDPSSYPDTESYKSAVDRETRRAGRHAMVQFLKSDKLIPHFMELWRKKKEKMDKEREEREKMEMDPRMKELMDLLKDFLQKEDMERSGEPGEGKPGEPEEGKPGEPGEGELEEGEPDELEEGRPGKSAARKPGKPSAGKPGDPGLGEAPKVTRHPTDGDLAKAIRRIEERRRKGAKAGAKGKGPKPSPVLPSVKRGSSDGVDVSRAREARDRYAEGVRARSEEGREHSKQVQDFIQKTTNTARRKVRRLRQELLDQAQREYEVYSRGGGTPSIGRFIEMKPDFFIETIEETDIETIDFEILIDLSGSMKHAKEHLAGLAVLLAAQLGDLGDVGINFQVRGLDDTGRPVFFKEFAKGKVKKIKQQELIEMFQEMIRHIGAHGAENFSEALIQSSDQFTKRKSKHKLVFLISDGQDTSGRIGSDDKTNRYVNGNPNFYPILDQLEKEKVTVIGVGAGRGSQCINMFPRYVNLGENYDLIGDFVVDVILHKVTKSRNKLMPLGDLGEYFGLFKRRRGASATSISLADRSILMTLHRYGLLSDSDFEVALRRLAEKGTNGRTLTSLASAPLSSLAAPLSSVESAL